MVNDITMKTIIEMKTIVCMSASKLISTCTNQVVYAYDHICHTVDIL